VHEGPFGGHFGKSQTFRQLASMYKWEGLAKSVADYSCDHCLHFKWVKGRFADRHGPMVDKDATQAWERVGIDIVEIRDKDGKPLFFLILSCYFSKFVDAVQIFSKSSLEVICAILQSAILDIGTPDMFVGDDDPAFSTAVFSDFIKSCSATWTCNAAYHHQGFIERVVLMFKPILEAKFFSDNIPFKMALRAACGAMTRFGFSRWEKVLMMLP